MEKCGEKERYQESTTVCPLFIGIDLRPLCSLAHLNGLMNAVAIKKLQVVHVRLWLNLAMLFSSDGEPCEAVEPRLL